MGKITSHADLARTSSANGRGRFVRRATSAVFAGAVAAGILVGAPASAQAAALACELHIGKTYKSGSTIVGYGSQTPDCGPNGVSTLTIQRSRWYGWENLASATVRGPNYDQYVRYNCSGTGTHTYRTIHQGRTIGGSIKIKISNEIRVSC